MTTTHTNTQLAADAIFRILDTRRDKFRWHIEDNPSTAYTAVQLPSGEWMLQTGIHDEHADITSYVVVDFSTNAQVHTPLEMADLLACISLEEETGLVVQSMLG